ncbi:MAG: transcription termination factor NusA [Acutalibacteraceae bacterium]|nr:transcription termination factor NusA [Acutalibacteraceae bacterium]
MDKSELFKAIAQLEEDKGVPADYMFAQIQKAIEVAAGKNYGNDDVRFIVDKEKGIFEAYLQKEVVEEVFDNNIEISVEKAREINPNAVIGDYVGVEMDTMTLGRIGVNAARNVIKQGINEGEKGQIMLEFQSKIGELVTANVERIDARTGNATVRIGKSSAVLLANEQVAGEQLVEGQLVKVYISDVQKREKGGPRVLISRTHPEFVKRLFETEVPEIYDGIVEIKSVSREAGSRTKIAVYSKDKQVDAIGACIGTRGARVGTIVEELNGEKIDIIEYDENPKKFIAAALSPSSVVKVQVSADGTKVCRVTVPDSQLSLAIGNKGQNARLAAKLTGWKIDIRPESGFFGEEDDDFVPADDDAELIPVAEEAEPVAEQSEEIAEAEESAEAEVQEPVTEKQDVLKEIAEMDFESAIDDILGEEPEEDF